MAVKKNKKLQEDNEGVSLDDAFGDEEDVEYAKPKPKKIKKKDFEEKEPSLERQDFRKDFDIKIKSSKLISKIRKGDKIKIDGKEYEVDAHYVLINHGTTKEMVIEIFDKKSDKDFQLRYFDDQFENTLEFYELQQIVYVRKHMRSIEW